MNVDSTKLPSGDLQLALNVADASRKLQETLGKGSVVIPFNAWDAIRAAALRSIEQSEGTPTDAQIVAEAERRYEPYRGASVPQTLLREPFIEGAKWMREHALKQADAGAIQRLRGLRESQVPGPFLTVPREVVDAICDGGRQPEDDHAMVVACDAKQYTSDAETKAFRDGWKSRVPTIQAECRVTLEQINKGAADALLVEWTPTLDQHQRSFIVRDILCEMGIAFDD